MLSRVLVLLQKLGSSLLFWYLLFVYLVLAVPVGCLFIVVIVAATHACVYFLNLVSYIQRAFYRRKTPAEKNYSKANSTSCCSAGHEMGLVNNNFTEFADEAIDEPAKENSSKGSEASESGGLESAHFPTDAEIFLCTYRDNGGQSSNIYKEGGTESSSIGPESTGSQNIVCKLRLAGIGLGDHCTHESAASSQECPSSLLTGIEYSNDVTLRERVEILSATTDSNFFSGKLKVGAGAPSMWLSSLDSTLEATVRATALSHVAFI